MSFTETAIFDNMPLFADSLKGRGAFLVTGKGRPNPMTIGWATLGVIWGKPILTVLVRPSRYSFELINSHNEFAVCVPAPSTLESALAFCGSRSGRAFDKFAECGMTREKGIKIEVDHIAECSLLYECSIVHRNEVIAPNLDSGIISRYYGGGDLHYIYYGEVLGAYINTGA